MLQWPQGSTFYVSCVTMQSSWSSSRLTVSRESARTCMHNLGQTRSANRRDHFLFTPDTFVRTMLPGMERAVAVVHVSPAAGASFTQYTAELESGGMLGHAPAQRFLYVLSGTVDLTSGGQSHPLQLGSYAYIPADTEH